MPRSTRQKSSSKHGASREAKDYSDSEKDLAFKDRKGSSKEDTSSSIPRISKEVGSSEKRKLTELKDSKDHSSRNGDYSEEYMSSSKRREKAGDDGGDRWTGGGVAEDEKGDGMKKSGKEKWGSKSKRREESIARESDSLERNVSSGKGEGKRKDSYGRKEGRNTGSEKNNEKDRERGKKSKEIRSDKFTDVDESRREKSVSDKAENQVDRKLKKKKDLAISDKHVDSQEDVSENGRSKEEKQKNKYRDEKRDQINRLEDKEARKNKQRHDDGEQDRDRDSDFGWSNGYDRNHDGNFELDDDDRDWDWEHNKERKSGRNRGSEQGGGHEKDRLNDSYGDKDSRGKRRSPDDYDDYNPSKSRSRKKMYNDLKKPSSAVRGDSDADEVKSHPVHFSAEKTGNNTPRSQEEKRKSKPEEKFRDSEIEENAKSKQRSEKYSEVDGFHLRELSQERSSGRRNFERSTSGLSGEKPNRDMPDTSASPADSPFHHKRVGDHLRSQGNSWRGPPNWPSPMPNGFIPFQHGPPHSPFQPMIPQFPPLFNLRPSLDINHSGMPYHIADSDRFSGHFRPIGWQNIMDGSTPPMWEGNNAIFEQESHLFGGSNLMKGPDDMGMEIQPSVDEDHSSGDTRNLHRDEKESNHSVSEAKGGIDKMSPDEYKAAKTAHFFHTYLSKLDISAQLSCPNLYAQFMNVMNIDPTSSIDDGYKPLVSLKERADPSCSSFLPACNDLISRRALDLYKKHRAVQNAAENSQSAIIENVPNGNGVDSDQEKLQAFPSAINGKQENSEQVFSSMDDEQERPEKLTSATDDEEENPKRENDSIQPSDETNDKEDADDTLMTTLNESESNILSRIHH